MFEIVKTKICYQNAFILEEVFVKEQGVPWKMN